MLVPCGGNASNSYEGGSSEGVKGWGSGGVMVGLTLGWGVPTMGK